MGCFLYLRRLWEYSCMYHFNDHECLLRLTHVSLAAMIVPSSIVIKPSMLAIELRLKLVHVSFTAMIGIIKYCREI
jgi:hypothetical protein